MEIEYLNSNHLVGFDNYKYSCKDTGILSIYVMHPFWNWLVQFCPKWIAPNLLTFSGFLFAVVTFVMFGIIDYNFYAADPDHPEVALLPNWSYLLAAVFIYLAYTLDGIDGKQARRTGTSGPLGELFDHGLDSYTAGLIPISMYSIFGRGARFSIPPYRMFFTMWNVLINFYLSHFEKYNTGVLFLPWGYDFSMWGIILIFFVAGIGGSESLQFNFGGITTGMVVELLLYISALISNVPIVAYNIYKSYKDQTGHMRSFAEAVRPLVPILFFFVMSLLWILKSPSNIVEADPRAFFFLLGNVFSNISVRLIVAQMSHTRCDLLNWLLVPIAACVFLSLSSQWATLERALLYFLCVVTTLAHVHYGACVVRQMCRHFKINCFSIKKHSD